MRRLFAAMAVALSLAVAGCAGQDVSVLRGGSSILAPTANPVTREQVYAITAAYGSVLVALNAYRRLPLCAAGQTETLTNLCARRNVIVSLQGASRQARFAIQTLNDFVKRYPQLNALDAYNEARRALDAFKSLAQQNGLKV